MATKLKQSATCSTWKYDKSAQLARILLRKKKFLYCLIICFKFHVSIVILIHKTNMKFSKDIIGVIYSKGNIKARLCSFYFILYI